MGRKHRRSERPGALEKAGEDAVRLTQDRLANVLDRAGERTVVYLRSYTGATVPAPHASPNERRLRQARLDAARIQLAAARARKDADAVAKLEVAVATHQRVIASYSQTDRPAHPGGWGDRSKALMHGYRYEVVRESNHLQVVILNDARHAHLVEAMEGKFVVKGVADAGGPLDRAIREAVRHLAIDWDIT